MESKFFQLASYKPCPKIDINYTRSISLDCLRIVIAIIIVSLLLSDLLSMTVIAGCDH